MATAPVLAERFLDPTVLAGTRDLALVARRIVEGLFAGRHLDLRPGLGVEFSQYRAYQPGDDLRRVDWRAYGRSDRLTVREAEVDRDTTLRIVLDASRSMAYGDPPARRGAPTLGKLEYGCIAAACLAYLAERQGDRLAFHALVDGGHRDLEPGRRGSDLSRLCTLLASLEASGRWPSWTALSTTLAGDRRSRQLVIVLSDLYQHDDEMVRALEALVAARNEVIVLQLMGRGELELDWHGDLVFEDLETGERVRADADALRPAYRERLGAFLDGWRRRLLDLGVDHHLIRIDQPLDQALRAVLLRRRRLP